MRIMICNSPWSKPGYYGVRAGSRWPHFEKCGSSYMPFPFFIAYAAALLELNGFEVAVVDAVAEGLNDSAFFEKVQSFSPDLLVFEVSTPSFGTDLKTAIKSRSLLGPATRILFCGPHKEMYTPSFLQTETAVDIVVKGEYEFALLDIANSISTSSSIADVPGILYRDGDLVRENPDRLPESDLGRFPWPARHLLPMDQYLDLPGGIPAPSLQIWASRGCPYGCIFCSWPQIMYGGRNYRSRDPRDVVDEIEFCIKEFGFKSFYFDDDTFNIGKQRILELCEEIVQRKITLPWAVMARADCMDREMLEAMKRAGLVSLKYGVESADPSVLAASGKALDLDRVRETIALTKELGILFHLTFTFGLPGETAETIKKTVDFAVEMSPDSLQFSIVTPFPGSSYFETLDNKGYLLSRNWEEYDGYNRAVIRTDSLTASDLERALKMADRRWKRHVFFRSLRMNPVQTLRLIFDSPLELLKIYYG